MLAAVSSPKWNAFYSDCNTDSPTSALTEYGMEDPAATSSAAVSLVLDSLDEIQCLTSLRDAEKDFLHDVLQDSTLHTLLNVSAVYSIHSIHVVCVAWRSVDWSRPLGLYRAHASN